MFRKKVVAYSGIKKQAKQKDPLNMSNYIQQIMIFQIPMGKLLQEMYFLLWFCWYLTKYSNIKCCL